MLTSKIAAAAAVDAAATAATAAKLLQSCPTVSDHMDGSLPGSSVHGIFQARVLEWGAIAFSETIMTYAQLTNVSRNQLIKSFFSYLSGKRQKNSCYSRSFKSMNWTSGTSYKDIGRAERGG